MYTSYMDRVHHRDHVIAPPASCKNNGIFARCRASSLSLADRFVLTMAEVTGLVLGAVALSSLFSTCVEIFVRIQLPRVKSRDLALLHQKLENQQARFIL